MLELGEYHLDGLGGKEGIEGLIAAQFLGSEVKEAQTKGSAEDQPE
jgi:hypothetical protein